MVRDGRMTFVDEAGRAIWGEEGAIEADLATVEYLGMPIEWWLNAIIMQWPKPMVEANDDELTRTTQVVEFSDAKAAFDDLAPDDIVLERRTENRGLRSRQINSDGVSSSGMTARFHWTRFRAADFLRPDRVLVFEPGMFAPREQWDLEWKTSDGETPTHLRPVVVRRLVNVPGADGAPIPLLRMVLRVMNDRGLDASDLSRAMQVPDWTDSTVRRVAASSAPPWDGTGSGMVSGSAPRATARGPMLIYAAGATLTACVAVSVWRRLRVTRGVA